MKAKKKAEGGPVRQHERMAEGKMGTVNSPKAAGLKKGGSAKKGSK